MAGAIICLLFSTIYHLFNVLNAKAQLILSRMDYGGVNVLILGSTFPPIVYGFACYPVTMLLYLTFSCVFCTASFVITLLPNSDQPEFRKVRGILFVVVGLLAGASPLHSAISQ